VLLVALALATLPLARPLAAAGLPRRQAGCNIANREATP
jgi:hypothetical protein